MGKKGVRRYHLIASDLRGLIEAGEIPPGGKMPTEHQLAERYGVSRTMVRNALGALRRRGLVEARQGQGTFVVDGKPTDIEPFPADHPFSVRMADAEEARRLGLREGEPVIEVYHARLPIDADLRGTAHKVFAPSPCESCPAAR